VSPPDPRWFGGRGDTRPGEVVGHHDAAPYNAVWAPDPTPEDPDAGALVGFIDWDLAHPAFPLEDLAFVALTWVPLTARDVAAAARAGYGPAAELVAEGVADAFDRAVTELDASTDELSDTPTPGPALLASAVSTGHLPPGDSSGRGRVTAAPTRGSRGRGGRRR